MTYDNAQALAMDALWTLTGICDQVRDEHLERQTPCTGWDLRALLEHMTGQHLGVAAALSGSGQDLSDWQPQPLGTDLTALFASIHRLREALLTEPVETAWMPEIMPDRPLPSPMVLRAHLVDTVAHGWDVAASIGVPVEFGAPVLAEAYDVAAKIPDGPERDLAGAAFAHARPGGDQPTMAGYLALLGRDIAWTAAE